MLAVPEQVALAALPSLRTSGALVVDTLSVKSRMDAAIADAGREGEFLGLNPMFRPSLGPRGRAVIAVPYVDGPQSARFLDIVRSWGASVAVMDADRHDRLAAATQVLTHASVLAFGVALAELGVSADELIAVAPPPHRTLLALLARIAGGEPEVYWDVQAGNPHAGATRKALFDATLTGGHGGRDARRLHDADENRRGSARRSLRRIERGVPELVRSHCRRAQRDCRRAQRVGNDETRSESAQPPGVRRLGSGRECNRPPALRATGRAGQP